MKNCIRSSHDLVVNLNLQLIVVDIPSTSPQQKDNKTTDEIEDHKTDEVESTSPKDDVNEANHEKCNDEVIETEESTITNSSSDTLKVSTAPIPPPPSSQVSKAHDGIATENTNVIVSDDKTETNDPSKSSSSDSEDNLVDVEDSDDYLLHLESILKTIHTRFYSYYEEHEKVRLSL